jgi:hypothetical protein
MSCPHTHDNSRPISTVIALTKKKCYTSRSEYTASPDSSWIHGNDMSCITPETKERMDDEQKTNGGVAVRVWAGAVLYSTVSRLSSPLGPFSLILPRIFSGTSLRDLRASGPSTTRSRAPSVDRPPSRCSDPTFPSQPLFRSPAN